MIKQPPGYFVVDSGKPILRGPRPSLQHLTMLGNDGLRSILDLEGPQFDGPELDFCLALGIQQFAVPMSQVRRPQIDDVRRAVDVLVSSPPPILVHCHQGVDRTGIVCAAYRVWVQGHSVDWAWQEMMGFGFHRWRYLFWLPSIRRILES